MNHKNIPNKSNFNEVTYLGFALPDELQDELTQLDSAPHFATFNFSWSLIRAFQSVSDKINIISSQEIRNYPAVKKILFRTKNFHWKGFEIFVIGFLNIIVFKHLSKIFQLFRFYSIFQMVFRSDLLVVHGSHTPYLFFANIMKIFGKKILLVLTDEHGYFVSNDGLFGIVLRKIDYYIMRGLVFRFDAYICLSDRFITKFKLKNALLIPGIVSNDIYQMYHGEYQKDLNSNFHVVYAGNINSINGIGLLLSAIKRIKSPFLTVSVFGKGDMVGNVVDYELSDPRVSYRGAVDRNFLLVELLNANLLINPRPAKSIINEYSFPSKLIEFLSTGTPVLTAKADNIPVEIENCFLYFEEDSDETLALAIERAMFMQRSQLEMIGIRAAVKVSELYSENSLGKNIRQLF